MFNVYNHLSNPLTSTSISYPTLQKCFFVVIVSLTMGCGEAIKQIAVAGLW